MTKFEDDDVIFLDRMQDGAIAAIDKVLKNYKGDRAWI